MGERMDFYTSIKRDLKVGKYEWDDFGKVWEQAQKEKK